MAGFGDFSNLLKEDVDRLTLKHDEKALEFCLDKLEKEAGSLKYDAILKLVKKEGKLVLKQAKKLFAHQIAKEILEDIKKETL